MKCETDLRRFLLILFLGMLFFLPGGQLSGQVAGRKYYKNYSWQEYGHYPQNWMIARDSRGILYSANSYTLLEFDGTSWRFYQDQRMTFTSLIIDEDDRIYVGGQNHIGFLTLDSKGGSQYTSLLDGLDDAYKTFSNTGSAYALKDKIYFNTPKFLFRWDKTKKRMAVIKYWHRHESNNIFKCSEKIFVYDDKYGLLQVIDDSLKPLPGGKFFAGKEVAIVFPYDRFGKSFLIGTRWDGFYLYNGIKTVPFPTEAGDYLRKNRLVYGIKLKSSPDEFAIATNKGLVIIDTHGKTKYLFNKNRGLQNNNVYHIFEDRQGSLWLSLSNGITKLEYASPFETYDEWHNLPGTPMSINRHNGDLFVGTYSGLYFLSSLSTEGFQPISGISGTCASLLFVDDLLLVGTDEGVFLIRQGRPGTNRTILDILDIATTVLYRSRKDERRIWAATGQGLISMYIDKKTQRLTLEKKFKNTTADIRSIAEDPKGTIWLGTLFKGVIRLDFPRGINYPVVNHYGRSDGLPEGMTGVFFAAGHVIIISMKGIFRFDHTENQFIPDHTLGKQYAYPGKPAYYIMEDRNKNIWFKSEGFNIHGLYQPGEPYLLDPKPFRRIPFGFSNFIYPDPEDGSVWFGTNDGLVHFKPWVKKNYRQNFLSLVRSVRTISGKHTIFEGSQVNTKEDTNNTRPTPITLKFHDRNLHFEFAAPFLEDESRNLFQYFLKGYDKAWSAWVHKTYADYPELPPGTYRFSVRAKNIYQHLSSEDSFQFRILPPWYRTWWSFLSYIVIFFLVIFLAVKWRSRKLEHEKHQLEGIIKERTKEIKEKNQQLTEMDKIKSRFFANISHEFRTPLTLIMGPLEQILSTSHDKESKKIARMMLRNSQRLLNLVNQLLELAKFESNKMKLQASLQNVVPYLKRIIASFESLALQQKIELIFEKQKEEIMLYFDAEKLEKIAFNLISNAIKFTPANGKITITIKTNSFDDRNFPNGSVDISVSDTGIGIPTSQLDHIFERFHQADVSYEYSQKGSGIGLALTKELVILHYGKLYVNSSSGGKEKRSGTEFIIRLPLGVEHLKPEEIVQTRKSHVSSKPIFYDLSPTLDDSIEEVEESNVEVSEGVQKEKNIVLVVEDSEDMRNYIKGALKSRYRIVDVADGKQGIEKAKGIIPDLIISDIMMPGTDGIELCRILKKDVDTSHIPIILLTAKASEQSIIKGLATGADDYITKPFNTNILTLRINNLIDLRRQLQLKIKRQMTLQPDEIPISSVDEKFFQELKSTLEKNISDPEFNVDQLHKKLYMGRTSLYRKILALTGEPPAQFIRSYRLQRAAQFLKSNFGNVTDVSFAVGFSNTAYFSKCFKEKFHQSPSQYHSSEAVNQ